jgi:hypothetical protein
MKKLILTLALFCTGIICTNAQERTNNLPEETKKIINDIKYVDTKNLSDEEAAVVLRVLNKIKEVKVTEFKAVRANDIKNETIDKPDLKVVTQHLKNKPMIILDGFEISLEQFDNINPNSVEFIKILTGNAAVSLYGEKGSNGVFIISSAVQNSSPTVNRLQRPISAINSKVAPIIKKFKQDGNQVSFRLIIPKTDNSKKQQIDIVYQLEN